jgi:putative membrane protein
MMLAHSLHIVFLAVWSAALMYMPLLFVRQLTAPDADTAIHVQHIERWMYAYIMTPSAVATVLFGIWLIFERGFEGGWLPVKLALVVLMGLFHVYCGHVMIELKRGNATRRAGYYRVLLAVPALLIVAIVTLVTGKPF